MKELKDFNIVEELESLSKRRPIFHNERDFQFEFALLLKEMYNCDVRLEYFYSTNDDSKKRCYIDIVLQNENECILIELKYKTKEQKIDYKGESFMLLNQAAQDFGCYYVLSDLSRIERIDKLGNKKVIAYYSVLLTNDSHYENGFRNGTLFSNFSLRDGKTIKGKLEFIKPNDKELNETCVAKLEKLSFNKEYDINWRKYSKHLNYVVLGRVKL